MGSVFKDKSIQPTDELLRAALAGSKEPWDCLISHFFATYKNPCEEWKYYGANAGWVLALFCGKRRLANLIPNNGFFNVGFTFSEKAIEAVLDSDLPYKTKALIPEKTDCVCGRGIEPFVLTGQHLGDIKKLLEIKDKN